MPQPQQATSPDLVERYEVERFNSSRGEIGKDTLLCPFCGRILAQGPEIGTRYSCMVCKEEFKVTG